MHTIGYSGGFCTQHAGMVPDTESAMDTGSLGSQLPPFTNDSGFTGYFSSPGMSSLCIKAYFNASRLALVLLATSAFICLISPW